MGSFNQFRIFCSNELELDGGPKGERHEKKAKQKRQPSLLVSQIDSVVFSSIVNMKKTVSHWDQSSFVIAFLVFFVIQNVLYSGEKDEGSEIYFNQWWKHFLIYAQAFASKYLHHTEIAKLRYFWEARGNNLVVVEVGCCWNIQSRNLDNHVIIVKSQILII